MIRFSALILAAVVGCNANPSPDDRMPDAGAAKSTIAAPALPMAAMVRSALPMATPDTYACRSGTSGIKNCGTPLQAPLGGFGYVADATAPSDGQGQVFDAMSGAYKLKTLVTSPITGTITANQGTGAGATGPWSCELSDGSTFYTTAKTGQFPSALVGGRLDVNVGAATTLSVIGPLTDTQLRASTVPVSGTFWQTTQPVSGTVAVSNFPATQPISAASLPLPTGAATAALQTTGNTSVGSIDTKTPALGQTVMASSSPVVIASNQSNVPVSQLTASNLKAQVFGGSSNGSAPSGNPVLISGSDGTTTWTWKVDGTGVGWIKPAPAGSVNASIVSSSLSSQTLLAANTSRTGVSLSNNSTAILYLIYSGGTPTANLNNVIIPPNTSWFMPAPIYQGVIGCIWSAINGQAYVIELQ